MKVLKCRLRQVMATKDKLFTQKTIIGETGLSARAVRMLYKNDFGAINKNTVEVLCNYLQCEFEDLFELIEEKETSL